jgi:hypothetical protein
MLSHKSLNNLTVHSLYRVEELNIGYETLTQLTKDHYLTDTYMLQRTKRWWEGSITTGEWKIGKLFGMVAMVAGKFVFIDSAKVFPHFCEILVAERAWNSRISEIVCAII